MEGQWLVNGAQCAVVYMEIGIPCLYMVTGRGQ